MKIKKIRDTKKGPNEASSKFDPKYIALWSYQRSNIQLQNYLAIITKYELQSIHIYQKKNNFLTRCYMCNHTIDLPNHIGEV